jgi:hypothetical protein
MKEFIQSIGIYIIMLVIIWTMVYFMADGVKDYEIVTPEEGVKCIIVSRLTNTSVACWETETRG